MDKVTPKSDMFQANRDRRRAAACPIEGRRHRPHDRRQAVPTISGATFETRSPIDGAVLATVARGNAEDIDRAATAAALAFKSWRDMQPSLRKKLLHRVADAIEDARDDSPCSNASISSALPRATVASTAPSIGDLVSKVAPEIVGTVLPSIMWPMPSSFNWASSGAARSRLA